MTVFLMKKFRSSGFTNNLVLKKRNDTCLEISIAAITS